MLVQGTLCQLGASRGAEGSNAGRGARGNAFGSGSRKRGRKGVAAFAQGAGACASPWAREDLPSSIRALKSGEPVPKKIGTVIDPGVRRERSPGHPYRFTRDEKSIKPHR